MAHGDEREIFQLRFAFLSPNSTASSASVPCIGKDSICTIAKNSVSLPHIENWLVGVGETDDTSRRMSKGSPGSLRGWGWEVEFVVKKSGEGPPIEFLLISLLIAASPVGQIQDDLRDEHIDIQMNNKVAKTMLDFIVGSSMFSKISTNVCAGREGKKVGGDGKGGDTWITERMANMFSCQQLEYA